MLSPKVCVLELLRVLYPSENYAGLFCEQKLQKDVAGYDDDEDEEDDVDEEDGVKQQVNKHFAAWHIYIITYKSHMLLVYL